MPGTIVRERAADVVTESEPGGADIIVVGFQAGEAPAFVSSPVMVADGLGMAVAENARRTVAAQQTVDTLTGNLPISGTNGE